LRDVADRAVGDDAPRQPSALCTLVCTAERAITDIGPVDVLDHRDARAEAGPTLFVIFDAAPGLLIGRQADFSTERIVTVRASRPSAAESETGRPGLGRVSRSGGARATISIALQIVGVS
jgi:hypothetical protein